MIIDIYIYIVISINVVDYRYVNFYNFSVNLTLFVSQTTLYM